MNRSVYCFATFRLDVAARELYADGTLLTVSPKVFDGLVWLIEHRDRAVGRDELMAAVWGRTDVTDAQLGQLMRKLRRTVGDFGDNQSSVRTIPRFGYRWVADTHMVEGVEPVVAGAGTPNKPPPRRRRIAQVMVLAAFGLVAVFVWGWHSRFADERMRNVVAVLPVSVEPSGNPEFAWLRLGLMEQVATRLRASGLHVVPSATIAATARNDGTPLLGEARAAAATGASRFAIGSVRRVAAGWVGRIEWRDGDHVMRDAEAHADSAQMAMRQACDRLLFVLGRATTPDVAESGDTRQDQWLPRIDAAMLDGDFNAVRRLLDAAPPDQRETPDWLLRRADVDLATQRMGAAKDAYQALLARVPPVDVMTRVRAMIGASGPIAQDGDLDGAEQLLGNAVDLLRGRNAPDLLGEALYGRGVFRMVQGELGGAEDDFAQARIAFDLAGDSLQIARLQGQQATLLALRNRHAEALAAWSSAAERFERFGDAEKLVDALGNAAIEQLALLQPQAAAHTVQRAEPWLPRLDQPLSEALFNFVRARVDAALGRTHAARKRFETLLTGVAVSQIAGMPAAVQIELAQLDLASGDAIAALTRAKRADAALQGPALASVLYGRIRDSCWLVQIRSLNAMGKMEAANEVIRRFAQMQPSGIDLAYLQLAEAETLPPDKGAIALLTYARSLDSARDAGAPADIAKIVASYGAALLQAGDVEHASAVIGQVAHWAGNDFDCAVLQARLYLALRQPEALEHALASVRDLAGERPLPPDLAAIPAGPH